MADIVNELEEYAKKNNVQDFVNKVAFKVLEHKPANPLFYLYIQNVISKEKNEKVRSLLECHYDLMVYRNRPETGKSILPDLFHKLSVIDPGPFQDPTVSRKYIEKLTSMVLLDFPTNTVKLVLKKIGQDYDANLEYDQFENVIDTLMGLLSLFDELKEFCDEINERSEGIVPEDICQFIDKSRQEDMVMLSLKNLLERSELVLDSKKFGNFNDILLQLLDQAL